MPEVTLTGPPALAPLLLRGALRSPFKRPGPDPVCPRDRLVLPGVRVDPARLARYERVCGFPTGEDSLPVTYPYVLGFPLAVRLMSVREFPLPLLGLVHTSVTVTRHRALPSAAEYELAVHIAGLAPHRRGTEATVVTQARLGGTVVWESASTYLARHRDGRGTAVERLGAEPLPVRARWELGGDVGRHYAAVSGDHNPIHLSPLAARAFGFRRAVAHGMWTVARCLAAYGVARQSAVEVAAEFRAPVPLPGAVEYGAGGGRFELRGGGRLFLSGSVRLH